jgi:hypothetical protein
MNPVEPSVAPTQPPSASQEPQQKPAVSWIFMPFELFFSLFPDITPYFAIFYFTVYQYILAIGIITMVYSYRVDELSYLSILMVYVGIRKSPWYLFYLYSLLWIGIVFLSKMVYDTPPWKVHWLPEIAEMHKKGDASPDLDTKPTKKSKYLDKIFDDVDSDSETEDQ